MRSTWTAVAAGVLGVLLAAPATRADDDTVRLGGNIEAKTTTLSYDGQSDTVLMRGVRGGFGFHGGFRGGYHVGYRGGFYGGGFRHVGYGGRFGGYRYGMGYYRFGGYGYGGYYAAYRPYYGYGYGGGYYSSPCYYPTYTYVTPYYNYAPPVYYTPGYSYYPTNAQVQVGQPIGKTLYVGPSQQPYQPMMPPAQNGNGTFPYDGGPANPIPLPKDGSSDQGPTFQPLPKQVPTDGRLVSIPAVQPTKTGSSGFAYPAYGEQGTNGGFAADRTTAVKTAKNNK